MATLILLRHAKSDWSTGKVDEERPLAPRGRRQAPLAGEWLAAHAPALDLALVSPAQRARETWALAAECLPEPPPVQVDDRIYDGWLQAIVAGLDPALETVVLVGHNPDLEELVTALTGEHVRMRTSELAVIDLAAWDSRGGRLVTVGRPPS